MAKTELEGISVTQQFEHEHKFLVSDMAFLGPNPEGTGLVQGYFQVAQGFSVRIRLAPGQEVYELTCKGPRREISRLETEISLTEEQAQVLLEACGEAVIDKTRYPFLADDGRMWTVDVFHGRNRGLVMAEIELSDPREKFVVPPFLGPEVTDDPRFYNDYLALNPFTTWP